MVNEIEEARALLRDEMDRQALGAVERLVARGLVEWRLDPAVPRVVGAVWRGTQQAVVVVYLEEGDWEADELALLEA